MRHHIASCWTNISCRRTHIHIHPDEGEVDPSSVTDTSVPPPGVPCGRPPANVRSTLASCLPPTSPTLCPACHCPRVSVQVLQLLLLATDQWHQQSIGATPYHSVWRSPQASDGSWWSVISQALSAEGIGGDVQFNISPDNGHCI